MEFFRSLAEFLKALARLPARTTVWRGEDGGYAVGESFPVEVEEGETDYTEAGKVRDYRHKILLAG